MIADFAELAAYPHVAVSVFDHALERRRQFGNGQFRQVEAGVVHRGSWAGQGDGQVNSIAIRAGHWRLGASPAPVLHTLCSMKILLLSFSGRAPPRPFT